MVINRSTILSSFIWKLLDKCSIGIVQFIVTVFLSRQLGPAVFGSVALIMIFVVLSDVIVDAGFNTALIQKKNSDNLDFSTVFYSSLVFALILYFILFTFAPDISEYFNQKDLTLPLRIISISLFFYSANSVQRAFAVKRMWFRKLFYSNIIAALLSGLIGIAMAYSGCGIWALVAQILSNIIFTCITMLIIVRWRPNLNFSWKRFRGLFNFGGKVFLTNLIINLFVRVRGLVIGKHYSSSILAFYSKGEQFPGLISDSVLGSIQSVLFPAFSEVQEDRIRVKTILQRSINISCFFIFPAMIGLAICSKPLVLLLLKEEWLPCVPFIQILSLSYLFCPITIANNQALLAMGFSGLSLKMEFIRKIVDIVILIVSCMFDAIAIAWGVLIYNFLCLFINLYPNIKILGYPIIDQINNVFPSFVCAVLMGVILIVVELLVPVNPFIQLLLLLLTGVSSYLLFTILFNKSNFSYIRKALICKFLPNVKY